MFTGIVTGTGTVREISKSDTRSAMRLVVDLGEASEGLGLGQSVALNGVCLTAVERAGTCCTFEMVEETARRTDLGNLREGGLVNVERSLKVGGRLEGHFVLGHVDGVGTVREILREPEQVLARFEIPAGLAPYVVEKGSISIDGISLTVTNISGNIVSVALIPHTVEVTNFCTRKAGDRVNIETDILGKYAARQSY